MPRATELQDIVGACVALGAGIDRLRVIPGNEDGPRPEGSTYATLLLRRDERLAYPVFDQLSDGAGTAQMTYRRATFSLQFYRAGATDAALQFCTWAESENGLTVAEDKDIRIVNPLSFERIDEVVFETLEERVVIDLGVDYVQQIIQDTGWIDQFDGEICTDNSTTRVEHG